jgi:hypothetical protein
MTRHMAHESGEEAPGCLIEEQVVREDTRGLITIDDSEASTPQMTHDPA